MYSPILRFLTKYIHTSQYTYPCLSNSRYRFILSTFCTRTRAALVLGELIGEQKTMCGEAVSKYVSKTALSSFLNFQSSDCLLLRFFLPLILILE